jgi:hypothetical protein
LISITKQWISNIGIEILKAIDDKCSKCTMCRKLDKTAQHLTEGCTAQVKEEYITCHCRVCTGDCPYVSKSVTRQGVKVERNKWHENWLNQVKIIDPLYSKTNKQIDQNYTTDMA